MRKLWVPIEPATVRRRTVPIRGRPNQRLRPNDPAAKKMPPSPGPGPPRPRACARRVPAQPVPRSGRLPFAAPLPPRLPATPVGPAPSPPPERRRRAGPAARRKLTVGRRSRATRYSWCIRHASLSAARAPGSSSLICSSLLVFVLLPHAARASRSLETFPRKSVSFLARSCFFFLAGPVAPPRPRDPRQCRRVR